MKIRLTIMEERGYKCERCGYDKEQCVLHAHHKDRDKKNNSRNNLEILCANCHYIEHFKKTTDTVEKAEIYYKKYARERNRTPKRIRYMKLYRMKHKKELREKHRLYYLHKKEGIKI